MTTMAAVWSRFRRISEIQRPLGWSCWEFKYMGLARNRLRPNRAKSLSAAAGGGAASNPHSIQFNSIQFNSQFGGTGTCAFPATVAVDVAKPSSASSAISAMPAWDFDGVSSKSFIASLLPRSSSLSHSSIDLILLLNLICRFSASPPMSSAIKVSMVWAWESPRDDKI